MILRTAWRTALGVVGSVIPAADRQYYKMTAQDQFKTATQVDEKDPLAQLRKPVIIACIGLAGEDPEQDAAYQNVLGLSGKKEFDTLIPE